MNLAAIEMQLKSDDEVIPNVLEKWAKTTPNKTFFFYGEQNKHISYQEFNQLANSIGHSLRTMGVEKGDRVSVFLKNPLVTSLVMFGIWKVGAVFSPINYSYFGRLLAYQINDTNPKILITEKDLVSSINAVKNEIGSLHVVVHSPQESDHDYNAETAEIALESQFQETPFASLLNGETSNLETNLTYRDTANIIYTSGTTGPAKGVVQSYRWMNQYTFFGRVLCHPDDVVYNDLPLYHVGGAFQNVARAAWVGCTVAVWDRFSPHDFWNRIKISGSSTCILLDVMIPWLLSLKETPNDRLNTMNKAYMQPMPMHHNQIAKRFGFDIVLTGYGQTEGGNAFAGVFEELDEEEGTPPELYKGYSREELRAICAEYDIPLVSGKTDIKKGFMGKPQFFLQASILNENDEYCQPEEAGQICFRPYLPYTLFNEYFGKPEATAKEFGNLWFHTGDAGYYDENGFFYFVDRMGGFIRRRGENISSYQIEDIINNHPEVQSCAAFPIPAEVGDEDDIVVYVVRKPGKEFTEKELLQWAEENMPKFMWPQHIRFVAELPRTPTNKLEKYKLKEAILKELGRE